MALDITPFFHKSTFTLTYVVADTQSKECVVIDPALDFDLFSGTVSTEFADEVLSYINNKEYQLTWILETHAHADHLSSSDYLKAKSSAKIAIGAGIVDVQKYFVNVFGLENTVATDGSQFDRLLQDGEKLSVGAFDINVMTTPGHTNDSVAYLIEDNVFVGDTLFMPDSGTARCDFPGGDARQLFHSIQKILSLPGQTKMWMCHDYQPNGRELEYVTTVAEQAENNLHIGHHVDESEYVEVREKRDSGLKVPKLIYPSLQVNIQAGKLPVADAQGRRLFKLPATIQGDWT